MVPGATLGFSSLVPFLAFFTRPASRRQRRVSAHIHANYEANDDNDGADPSGHGVAIEDNGPKACDDNEALPRITGGPGKEADSLIQR